ncbi:MAG: hypothetical protein HOV80_14630 [Polyangiaceae bacterium]|nr:hypothetical protein [Polyangiaceae bacterium]
MAYYRAAAAMNPNPTETPKNITVIALPCGGHVEVRVEDDKPIVLIALPAGGHVRPRWGTA